jgi:hypothetical protein
MVSKNGDVLLVGSQLISKYDMEKDELSNVMEVDSPSLSYTSPHHDNLIVCAYNREKRIAIYDRQSKK